MTILSQHQTIQRTLAIALGWIVTDAHGLYGLRGIPPQLQDPAHPDHQTIHRWHQVPNWVNDNNPCFSLMVEHGIVWRKHNEWVSAECLGVYVTVRWDEHPNQEAAVRMAIALAVIQKMVHEKAMAADRAIVA